MEKIIRGDYIENCCFRSSNGLIVYDQFKKHKSEFDLVIDKALSPEKILDYIIETLGFEK